MSKVATVDLSALRKKTAQATKGDDLYFRFNAKTDGVPYTFRFPMFEAPMTNFFLQLFKLWLNPVGQPKGAKGRNLVSLKTFGESYCPLDFGLKEAHNALRLMEGEEKEVMESRLIIEGYKGKPKRLRVESEFQIPCFLVEGEGEDKTFTPKILVASNNLLTALSGELLSDAAMKISPQGYFSLTEGEGVIITRNGVDMNTSYTVTADRDPCPIPEKALKVLPNLTEIFEKQRLPEDELQTIIETYLDSGVVLSRDDQENEEEESIMDKIKKKGKSKK